MYLRRKVRSKEDNLGQLSPVQRWTLAICLLLVTIAVAGQTLHSHQDELSADARHCTICQVAHTAAQVAPVAPVAVTLTTTSFLISSVASDPKQGPDSFSLFCRPPPLV